jgi:hypothetical protein
VSILSRFPTPVAGLRRGFQAGSQDRRRLLPACHRKGKGLSAILMHNYVLRMRQLKKESIQLMYKDRHIALYEKFGFRYVKRSASSLGGMSWHEMILNL